MNKKVIYTVISGDSYYLHDPEVISPGYDYICFTDSDCYKSDIWNIKKITPLYSHGGLNNRKYKVLPHRFLSNYEFSIYVDGDLKITSDLDILAQKYKNNPLSVLDHSLCGVSKGSNLNSRNCIYDEANFIKWLGDNHPRKNYKDNISTIFKQMEIYQIKGYPTKNGLARTSLIMRNHNDLKVIKVMEDWWLELKYWSKRDQLSFPYVCWKHQFNYNFISEDIDSNKWIKLLKKWRTQQNKKPKTPKFQPISFGYFLNMELANGGGGKEVIKQNGELNKIGDIIKYFSNKNNVKQTEKQLTPKNGQYYNCMMAEFRHNVGNHHDLGWENMTKEYYENLDLMSDEEIEQFLKDNPVEFDNGYIRHNYHRACAMIGRLIRGKSYIPFYMKTSQIYNEPRKKDGMHRVKPLTNKIKLLEEMDKIGIDKNDYCLTQSSILSLMGIRDNDDLDIIISSKLRNQNIQFPSGVDVFAANRGKFNYFGAKGDDDILENYCIEIDGYKFLEPRFYFARKNNTTERDKVDWSKISWFFKIKSHEGYPYNFDFYKWGVNFVDKVQLKNLKIEGLKPIINKYNRITDDGVNHGRSVYYDVDKKQYIKIFHPEYCRLSNLKEAFKSNFLNGLCPALTKLIYNGGNLVGYICEEGSHPAEIPKDFLTTILRNCKKWNKVYYDIVPQNIIKLPNGEYSLIDLESVYGLDELDLLPKHNAQIKPTNLLELINRI